MRLRTKLLLPYFMILMVMGTVIHFVLLPDLVEGEIKARQDLENRYISLLSASLTPDLLSMDLAKVHGTLDLVMKERTSWASIVLKNSDGLRLYPLEDEQATPGNLSTVKSTILFDANSLGSLTASIDFTPIDTVIRSKFFFLELIFFSFLIGGALIGIILQDYWIGRPLKNLSRAAKELATGKFDVELPSVSKDEIGDFISAFEIMRSGLHEREQQMALARKVFENTGEAIVVTNRDNAIIDANPSHIQQTGYTLDELMGINPKINKSGKHDKKFYKKMWKGILDDGFWSGEIWGKRKNGEIYPKQLTITVIRAQTGEISNYVGISRDISELKKIDVMKSEFISTVSHELRTPLTSISGALSLVKHTATEEMAETTRTMIDIAHKNSLRLVSLVNDILDIEKIIAGEIEYNKEPLNVKLFLNDTLSAYEGYGEDRKIKFELKDISPKMIITGDKKRLMQVMANLMSNAAKFSPENARVMIDADIKDGAVQISVEDHGTGIPLDFRSKLFDKFTQADSSDSRHTAGTGLGMSITKAIVEKHDGTIWFETEVNVGTSFFIKFPAYILH